MSDQNRKKYLKRMRRRRYRRRRRAFAGLCAAVLAYLLFLGTAGEELLSVQEEYQAEISLPAAGEGKRNVFRFVLRLKTGEILFFHEETEIHNMLP